ncbi:MAG: hypothetical protein INQ03_14820 [Candidatus Heimdallarchaeota archaeon]|nr:hypothetical protein [Candidatus Heimdallarchaeota archaeon]
MDEIPEMLLRTTIFEEYAEKTIQISIDDLQRYLSQGWIGVFWNAYSMPYAFKIKPFPYPARNGYFVDIEDRVATHRFISKGIIRRDMILHEKAYEKIIPTEYRETWYDTNDAVRTYAVIITEISKLDTNIAIEDFGLFKSWGKVSKRDLLQRPRLVNPYFF